MHPENPQTNIRELLTLYQQRQPCAEKNPASEVEIIRTIVQRMLHALDEYTQKACTGSQEDSAFWNGKESPLSVLVKLTQVLSRLQDISSTKTPDETNDIPKNDMERLKAYARRLSTMGEESACKPAQE